MFCLIILLIDLITNSIFLDNPEVIWIEFFIRLHTMKKDLIIENTKKHIHELRKNSLILQEKDFKIALGKVIVDLKIAKDKDNDILKSLFSIKK